LDCSKAHLRLDWRPKLDLPTALEWTTTWYQAFESGEDVALLSEKQIKHYEELIP
jgi:CDP-glucose 4,6-dehydratase